MEDRIDSLEVTVRSLDAAVRSLEVAVAGIDGRLNAALPHLLTKAELHEALHALTWKMFGAVFGLAGLLLAGIKLWH